MTGRTAMECMEPRRGRLAGILACGFLFALAACGSERSTPAAGDGEAGGARPDTGSRLVFSASAAGTPEESYRLYRPLADYLGRKLGVDVQLVVRKSYAESGELFASRRADFGNLSPVVYIEGHASGTVDLLAVETARGSSGYRAQVIVHRNSPVRTFSDLRGKRFAFTDTLSSSGYGYPLTLIAGQGRSADSYFSAIEFTGNHDNSIRAVLGRRVDGASVADYILSNRADEHAEIRENIRVIESSSLLLRGPMVCSSAMPEQTRERIRRVLLAMSADEEGRAVLTGMKIDGFRDVGDTDYDAARGILRAIEGRP